ncbi:MAG: hypothetical protein MUF38_09325 [Anaerolineae bacterium]|nr:hypothetical protein [Anaerolineae bacterium]
MAKNPTPGRIDDLLASINSDMLDDPFSLPDNTVRVERILLEMVRPDPVQPRRVLPESITLPSTTTAPPRPKRWASWCR